MINKISLLSILTTCILTLLMASSGCSDGAKDTSTISAADRSLAMWEVQNTMSMHAYYHAAGLHLEELADIWVSETGPHAKTAKFSSPNWVMNGIATVKRAYGQANQDNKVRELEAISKIYPEVKNIPENLGAGHEFAMHTNTTPIIEIAGDGKTAKGIWYSPGIGLSTHIEGNNVSAGGTFFWEKYGADFVKEDGEWKIWHCQMFYDFTPSFPESMTRNLIPGGSQGGPPAGGQGPPPADDQGDVSSQGAIESGETMDTQVLPEGFTDNTYIYESFSPTRVHEIMPKFPEPYYTFSETFSY
ncbi:nuclear transport factor 2 family protein [Deltaproteobacteria bacterium]|nr:nuclear transport factor 2 family protein [Deltaproteobacteria bacterium]